MKIKSQTTTELSPAQMQMAGGGAAHMRLDGIGGEIQPSHGSGGGAGGGKVSFQDISFVLM